MAEIIKHEFQNTWEPSSAELDPFNGELEVNVIFTDLKRTAAALEAASELARDLNASTRVIAAQAVPFAFPLSNPPVAAAFLENLLVKLVSGCSDGGIETTIHLYLCRDVIDTLAQVLPPNSLVVMGGGRWFCDAHWIAKSLKSIGHQVIFASGKSASRKPTRARETGARVEQVRKHA